MATPLQQELFDKAISNYDAIVDFFEEVQRDILPEPVAEALPPWARAIVRTQQRLLNHGLASIGVIPIILGASLWAIFSFIIREVIGPTGIAILQLVDETRKEHTDSINKLMLSSMGELFGVDFSDVGLPEGASHEAAVLRAQIIGDRIYALLEKEFTDGGGLGPEQGERAAKRFTGFAANFAVSSAFISILGEAISAGQFEAFRELGVELADNLGLGRMTRRGLSELVSTTVSTPYEWHLNKKYRPAVLTPSQAIRAWFRQQLTDEELHEKLARDGYTERKMNALIDLERPSLSRGDVWDLLKWGALSRTQAVEEMKLRGWSGLEAELALTVEELREAEARVREHMNNLERMALDGIISKADFNELVDRLPLGEEEKRWERLLTGNLLELDRRRVSETDMESAFLNGLVTLSEYEQYLDRVRGYPTQDRQLLMFLLLVRAAEKSERDRRKRELEEKRKREQEQQQQP